MFHSVVMFYTHNNNNRMTGAAVNHIISSFAVVTHPMLLPRLRATSCVSLNTAQCREVARREGPSGGAGGRDGEDLGVSALLKASALSGEQRNRCICRSLEEPSLWLLLSQRVRTPGLRGTCCGFLPLTQLSGLRDVGVQLGLILTQT